MALLTLAEVKAGPVGRSCGISTASQDFVNIVNDACRQLMKRGNWWASVQPMSLPVSNGLIVCPREVENVLALRVKHHPVPVQNIWYSYIPWDDGYFHTASGVQKSGRASFVVGTSPVYQQMADGAPMYVRVVSSSSLDVGKQITFFGVDNNGIPAQCSLTINGLTFASSFSQGVMFSRIDRVLKSSTSGYITCWQDDNAGNLLPLSSYQPSETSPDYVLMRLVSGIISDIGRVDCLCRLSHIPVYADSDKVLIENQDALRDMVLSIRKKESGDIKSGTELETLAMRELNYQMRSRFPEEQTVVSVRPFGAREHNHITSIL